MAVGGGGGRDGVVRRVSAPGNHVFVALMLGEF